MIKKYLLYFILLTSVLGCSESKLKQDIHKISQKEADFKVSDEQKGFWVSEEYVKVLKETKSSKKACESGKDDFYKIYDRETIMKLNIHEGGEESVLKMTNRNTGQILSHDQSILNEVKFEKGTLIVDTKRFIKASDTKSGLKELVNQTFFSGTYISGDKQIEF